MSPRVCAGVATDAVAAALNRCNATSTAETAVPIVAILYLVLARLFVRESFRSVLTLHLLNDVHINAAGYQNANAALTRHELRSATTRSTASTMTTVQGVSLRKGV